MQNSGKVIDYKQLLNRTVADISKVTAVFVLG